MSARRCLKRIIIAFSLLVVLAGSLLVGGSYALAASLCGNDQIHEYVSPDGWRKAVVYRRDCGATTNWSAQMVVLPRWWRVWSWSRPNPIFASRGEMIVTPVWTDATHLRVRYSLLDANSAPAISRMKSSARSVSISYEQMR